MNINLSKKTAFILGGSGKIGSEICKKLIESNCKVINFDIKKNIQNNFIKLNLEKISESKKIFNYSFKKFGCPNIFINSSYPKKKSWIYINSNNFNEKILNENIKVHLNSYLFYTNFFAKKMKDQKIKGSIINISSIYGNISQNPEIYKNSLIKENIIYPAIKGSINSFSKQLAVSFGKYNIRVNTVCPGGIVDIKNKKLFKNNKNFINQYLSRVPLKRFCQPVDVANLCIFLSSDLSSYITGTNIPCDGGWLAV